MQHEIDELMRVLGFGELQAYRHARDRREFVRSGKVPLPRWVTREYP